jgi:hypothetical protein
MKKANARFPDSVIEKIHKDKILGIRAGIKSDHRVIGIWVVVVDGRVFVRSYQAKPGGWWQTLAKDPQGQIYLYQRKRGINIRAVQVKSEALKERVSAAYREKYNTPGSVLYVKEMSRSPSKDTTMELVAA